MSPIPKPACSMALVSCRKNGGRGGDCLTPAGKIVPWDGSGEPPYTVSFPGGVRGHGRLSPFFRLVRPRKRPASRKVQLVPQKPQKEKSRRQGASQGNAGNSGQALIRLLQYPA